MSRQTHAPGRPQIGVVFSHGTTLRQWKDSGIFDREIAYLRRLHEAAGEIRLLTYDRPGEGTEALRKSIAPLRLCERRVNLDYRLYGVLAPVLQPRMFLGVTVLRTTQLGGAWMGTIAKVLLGKRLVVRCGYVRSRFYSLAGMSWWRTRLARLLEATVIRSADRVLAATEADIQYLMRISGREREHFVLLPNPIDVGRFAPRDADRAWSGKILFVGRLHDQKNLFALITAMGLETGLHLTIAGDGPLRRQLENASPTDRVTFLGAVDNSDIPDLLGDCDAFVLPSHYEGNPKSLMEALAAGCAVVGARREGIVNLVEDGVNGVLCETNAESIAAAIRRLRDDPALRRACRIGARSFALEHFDSSTICARESQVLGEVIRGARADSEEGAP